MFNIIAKLIYGSQGEKIPHSTDNALMIALAGYLNLKTGCKLQKAGKAKIIAEGRARLS